MNAFRRLFDGPFLSFFGGFPFPDVSASFSSGLVFRRPEAGVFPSSPFTSTFSLSSMSSSAWLLLALSSCFAVPAGLAAVFCSSHPA